MSAEQLKAQFEEALQKYKEIENDREKYISNRQHLESQLTENTLVKSEFDFLEEDAKVYKLIGACLIRQDIAEARANVEKRLEYINAEIKRVDDSLADSKEKAEAQKAKLLEMQQKFAAAK
uniref:Probable prefoldin subunit 6 n=1 Tax=Haemonchus contortus TaxID=6289 RepID=A0A7I4Y8M7_HAECO|nr:Prefoldin beta domain containing protein [Haemonchus contortus]